MSDPIDRDLSKLYLDARALMQDGLDRDRDKYTRVGPTGIPLAHYHRKLRGAIAALFQAHYQMRTEEHLVERHQQTAAEVCDDITREFLDVSGRMADKNGVVRAAETETLGAIGYRFVMQDGPPVTGSIEAAANRFADQRVVGEVAEILGSTPGMWSLPKKDVAAEESIDRRVTREVLEKLHANAPAGHVLLALKVEEVATPQGTEIKATGRTIARTAVEALAAAKGITFAEALMAIDLEARRGG